MRQMLDSVRSQTHADWELWAVDDRSTDNSPVILEEYATRDSRIKVLRNSVNVGPGASRNRAIEAAQGNIIAFLDADDIWHPEKLTRHLAHMVEKDAAFSHTSYGYIDAEGKELKKPFRVSAHPVSYTHLLRRTEISCLTAMYNADKIGKWYMTEHRRKQDYALWLNILRSGAVSHGLDEVLAYYRQHDNAKLSSKKKHIYHHYTFLKETQNMPSYKAAYYTLFWLVNGFVRYVL